MIERTTYTIGDKFELIDDQGRLSLRNNDGEEVLSGKVKALKVLLRLAGAPKSDVANEELFSSIEEHELPHSLDSLRHRVRELRRVLGEAIETRAGCYRLDWDVTKRVEQRGPIDAEPEPVPCPYPGIRSFAREEAALFFGREREVSELLDAIRRGDNDSGRWVQIEGCSGAGKSSLLFAGLLPAIRDQASVAGAVRVETLCPGLTPLSAITAALDRLRLADGAATELPCVLAIDQFEEALSVHPDELAAVEELLGDALARSRLLLITTTRSDRLGVIERSPRLARMLNGAFRYVLGPPTNDSLREAIVGPAEGTPRDWDKAVVDTLIADVQDTAAPLPALAVCLRAMWLAEPTLGTINQVQYVAVGGVRGCLERTADQTLALIDESDHGRVADALVAMVDIDENGRTFDRGLPMPVVEKMLGDNAERLVQVLTGSRRSGVGALAAPPISLCIASQDADGNAELHLAHDALTVDWDWLRDHLVRRREELRGRRKLEEWASLWSRFGKHFKILPQESAEVTEMAAAARSLPVTPGAREFLFVAILRDEARNAGTGLPSWSKVSKSRTARIYWWWLRRCVWPLLKLLSWWPLRTYLMLATGERSVVRAVFRGNVTLVFVRVFARWVRSWYDRTRTRIIAELGPEALEEVASEFVDAENYVSRVEALAEKGDLSDVERFVETLMGEPGKTGAPSEAGAPDAAEAHPVVGGKDSGGEGDHQTTREPGP